MIRMRLKATLAVLASLLASLLVIGVTHAETAVPDRLTIGYDNEGKVDAGPQACVATVKEITEWDKAQTEKGAKDVCAARKRHVEAYAALQSNYKAFVKAFSVDRRLNLPGAVSSFSALIKACMEHKSGLTTGGHNIMIDIIENDIATQCLVLGANLLKEETAKYTALSK
jgi:hypothetical protein